MPRKKRVSGLRATLGEGIEMYKKKAPVISSVQPFGIRRTSLNSLRRRPIQIRDDARK